MAAEYPSRLEEARALLGRYLSDEVPPLLFSDVVDDLFAAPPSVVANEIKAWVANQFRGSNPLPVADYLFHAAKKLHMLDELDLVSSDRLKEYLNRLNPLLIHACPEGDRQALAENLRHVSASTSSTSALVGHVHRPAQSGSSAGAAHQSSGPAAAGQGAGTSTPAGPAVGSGHGGAAASGTGGQQLPEGLLDSAAASTGSADAGESVARAAAGLERLNLLLDRLTALTPAAPGAGLEPTDNPALFAEILDEVASDARDGAEFENRLEMMESMGVPSLSPELIRSLGRNLPDWAPTVSPEGGPAESRNPSARAMRQVIRLAKDPELVAQRFRELLNLAIEEFNTGSLGRSVTLLDLAQRMVDAKDIDPVPAQNEIDQAYGSLEENRIFDLEEDPTRRSLLHRFLEFFPQLQVDSLFVELEQEERRDRRRILIRLLEIHGAAARRRAMELLGEHNSGGTPQPWFVRRNLVHVIRSISRDESEEVDPEIDTLVPATELVEPAPLVREALAALAAIPSPRVTTILTARVAEIEDVLLTGRTESDRVEELFGLLDTTTRLLAKIPRAEALECIVDHGLKTRSELGQASQRLTVLGVKDLSSHSPLVRKLVAALEAESPTKVFGINVTRAKKSERVRHLAEALAGTDTAEVRRALAAVVERYAGRPESEAAHGVLQRLGVQATRGRDSSGDDEGPSATLAGDLALFGLPGLIQNLADSHLTGTLGLHDGSGEQLATIEFQNGMIWRASVGPLTGENAIYQLIEQPVEAKFLFAERSKSDAPPDTSAALLPVIPLILEGMRRFDEFERASALVPDDAVYRHANRQPTAPEEERDADLLASVWGAAANGAPPRAAEGDHAVDAFRIRRLYEHWVSEGSLIPDRT